MSQAYRYIEPLYLVIGVDTNKRGPSSISVMSLPSNEKHRDRACSMSTKSYRRQVTVTSRISIQRKKLALKKFTRTLRKHPEAFWGCPQHDQCSNSSTLPCVQTEPSFSPGREHHCFFSSSRKSPICPPASMQLPQASQSQPSVQR